MDPRKIALSQRRDDDEAIDWMLQQHDAAEKEIAALRARVAELETVCKTWERVFCEMRDKERTARADEREECARFLEQWDDLPVSPAQCAAALRGRKEER